MAMIGINGQNYEVHEDVAEQFAKYMRIVKKYKALVAFIPQLEKIIEAD